MEIVDRHNTELETPPVKQARLDCQTGEHGGNIYRIAQELGVTEDKLIDFSASINPLGLSENVKDVIRRELDGLVNYPDPDSTELTGKMPRTMALRQIQLYAAMAVRNLFILSREF